MEEKIDHVDLAISTMVGFVLTVCVHCFTALVYEKKRSLVLFSEWHHFCDILGQWLSLACFALIEQSRPRIKWNLSVCVCEGVSGCCLLLIGISSPLRTKRYIRRCYTVRLHHSARPLMATESQPLPLTTQFPANKICFSQIFEIPYLNISCMLLFFIFLSFIIIYEMNCLMEVIRFFLQF